MNNTVDKKVKQKEIIEKMNGESLDIVKENVLKLKEIFPEVFCEDKIDFKKLEEVLGEYTDDSDERYRFEWHGKSKAIRIAQTPSRGTLRPCKEESKNWDTTENLYIEGDNLEVLKLLQKSYQGKIKMIYIDPPYNTGNDFIYPDNYSDNLENYLRITGQKDDEGNKMLTNSEAGGRYHTNWLNMMYPRLRLAKNLLEDNGVIFISIDDNELDNLKKICDEIFGEQNFLGRIMPVVNPGGRDYKQIALMHEYLLIYAKSDITELQEISKDIKFDMNDLLGGYELRDLRNRNPKFHSGNRPNLFYPFYVNSQKKDSYGCCSVSVEKVEGYDIEIRPYNSVGKESVWRWGRIKAKENIDINNIENSQVVAKPKRDGGWTICQKNRRNTTKVKSIWDETEMRTEDGTRLIRSIFEITPFDHPKPLALLNRIVEMGSEDGIVLDFFSGSATSAHSVININAQQNRKNKFIMVQLPEECDEKSEAYKAGYKNICEIGKERIRRAGDKIVEENKDKEGIEDLDIGFKVFKLDTSNIKPWNPDYDNLEMTLQDSIDNFVPERTQEDIVYEIMLKYGIDLTYPVETKEVSGKKIFSIGFGALLVCLDDDITLEAVNDIVKLKKELNPETCRVVFKDNGFKSDSIKTNAVEILKRNNIEEIMSI